MLTFEIVDFPSAYHAILGRPCYAKLMAILNYTYLKLKILGPRGIITVGGNLCQAHLCERENRDIATATCLLPELRAVQVATTRDVYESSMRKLASGAFKPSEDTKAVQVHPEDAGKMVRIGYGLADK